MKHLTAIEITAIVTSDSDPKNNPEAALAIATAQLKARDIMRELLESIEQSTHISFVFDVRYGKEND